ncbi:hypothetical protein [Paraburkholderia sp. J11-2]|uniref:hypothetical protein n=1 Tax=Paraburkholderia sp. J11-2 TaxID=2805431 RepID=UPI002AB6A04C|nr:hypothetical protein [Paraburkholderia sp. J11-2]
MTLAISMLRVEVAVGPTVTATTLGVVDCGTVPLVLVVDGVLAGLAALADDGALAGTLAPVLAAAVPLLPPPPQAVSKVHSTMMATL